MKRWAFAVTEPRQPDNHQPSQSSMYCTGGTECFSRTPGRHSVCAVRSSLRVDQKFLFIRKEPMLSVFSHSKYSEYLASLVLQHVQCGLLFATCTIQFVNECCHTYQGEQFSCASDVTVLECSVHHSLHGLLTVLPVHHCIVTIRDRGKDGVGRLLDG